MTHIHATRIDDLIKQHCPDGVEYRPMGEVGTIVRGKRFVKSDMVDSGVPCIHYGEIYTKYGVSATSSFSFVSEERAKPLRYAQPQDVIIASAGETIEDIGKAVAWLGTEPVVIHDACYKFSSPMNPKFVSYFLATNGFRQQIRRWISSSKISSISTQNLARALIPVPPLPVQEEIVRILDTFTQLEAELEAVLEAELEARQQQYEHYRGSLLKFDLNTVDAVMLADGFETRNGYTPLKSDPTNWEDGTVPWFRMEDIRENGRVLDRALQMIPEKAVKGGRYFPANSLIFSTSATIGEHALITVPFMSNQRFTAIWPKPEYAGRFDTKFLFFYGFVIDEWCRTNTTTSSFASVDMSGFKRLILPIPPMDEQKRIANQLDQFDALVNDLSVGLPAEIVARRQQYEYYRDRLLSFKELVS